MKILLLFHMLIALIHATGHSRHKQGHPDTQSSGEQKSEVSEAYMDFAIRLYKIISLRTADAPPNLFFSPLSIYSTLSIMALGARSTSRMEILQAMGLNATKTDVELHESIKKYLQEVVQQIKNVQFTLGNNIFVDKSVNVFPQYQQDMSYYYNTSVQTISFSEPRNAEKTINELVSDRAGNKIQNVVKDLDPKTLLVLQDYSVFQAKWETAFDPQKTRQEKFMVDEQNSVLVPIMQRSGTYKMYKDKEMKCNVVEVPFTSNMSLVLIVPQLGDLQTVERKLTTQRINKYLSSMKTRNVDLHIPKVIFNTPLKLKNAILAMGIQSIFSSDNADFSRMSTKSRLRVSDILHQSYTDIKEGGTDLHSAIDSDETLLFSNSSITFNRPFVTVACYETNIIFMGRVTNPG